MHGGDVSFDLAGDGAFLIASGLIVSSLGQQEIEITNPSRCGKLVWISRMRLRVVASLGTERVITLTINYGHDIHSIEVDAATYEAIKAGRKVAVDGQGFVHEEDGELIDHWVFNEEPDDIYFWLDNGAEFRAQDSWIETP